MSAEEAALSEPIELPVAGTRLGSLIPGHNVDAVDRAAGLAMLARLGYDDGRTAMVIDYALWRHGHGEEAAAEKCATDRSFYGIDFTSWRVVLAAAVAADPRNRPGQEASDV